MNILQSPQAPIPALQYNVDFNWWPTAWLARYIEKKQRKTITEKSIVLQQNIDLARNSCINQNIFFQQLDELFSESVDRLWARMKKEEENLFPIIREMLKANELNRCINRMTLYKVERVIALLNDEHDIESKRLKLSMQLRENYQVWKGRNKNVKALYTGLREFEQDVELHIYLQGKLLFPKLMILLMR